MFMLVLGIFWVMRGLTYEFVSCGKSLVLGERRKARTGDSRFLGCASKRQAEKQRQGQVQRQVQRRIQGSFAALEDDEILGEVRGR